MVFTNQEQTKKSTSQYLVTSGTSTHEPLAIPWPSGRNANTAKSKWTVDHVWLLVLNPSCFFYDKGLRTSILSDFDHNDLPGSVKRVQTCKSMFTHTPTGIGWVQSPSLRFARNHFSFSPQYCFYPQFWVSSAFHVSVSIPIFRAAPTPKRWN